MENMVVLPGMSVAAKGEVRSILVVAKKPIERAKRIALDASSRSSQALVKILAAEHWGIKPEFVETTPDASEMLKEADAALVIGDPALAHRAEDGSADDAKCRAGAIAARAIRKICRCRDSRRFLFTTWRISGAR